VNNQNLVSRETDELFDAILSLKSREECYMFFEDITTIQEVKALALRLQIAKRLYYNDETYAAISQEYGVSATTTGRVKNSIMYGSGGYRMILDRMREPLHH
jgi:TrpR-related protein YerC/YecD